MHFFKRNKQSKSSQKKQIDSRVDMPLIKNEEIVMPL